MSSKEYHFRDFLGKKVLIVGEVGSGKTSLTTKLICEAVGDGLEGRLTILDLAPKAVILEGRKISGRIRDTIQLSNRIRYLTSDGIRAPRVDGRSKTDVVRYARENRRIIEELFDRFIGALTPILFVNDVTLYLHLGDVGRLKDVLSKSETVIVNAYEGRALQADFGSGISDRERTRVNQLEGWMDLVIRTGRREAGKS